MNREREQYQIFGIRAVMEAAKAGKNIDKVFIQKGLKGELSLELEKMLKDKNIALSVVPVEKLNRLSGKNHQGVVATLSPIQYAYFETLVNKSTREITQKPLFLILDHLQDVRNIGAIIRTAECCKVSGVILPKMGSSITADTVKTSAGAAFRVPICRVDNIVDAVYYLQGSGIKVVAATEKSQDVVYEAQLDCPVAIVVGAEDTGISKQVLRVVDQSVKLPILGEISSLNVSVACGVFLYETVRQRKNY